MYKYWFISCENYTYCETIQINMTFVLTKLNVRYKGTL